MNISLEVLQAQGNLNRQITHALVNFRKKITDEVNKNQDKNIKDKYDTSKQGSQKIFRFRQSLLSLKFELNDYKTLYNMVAASLLILLFNLCYDNYVSKGTLIDVVAFMDFFNGWQYVFLFWWVLAVVHFSIIPILFVSLKTSSKIWIPLYMFHQYALGRIAVFAVYNKPDLGFASIFIILCQGIRMIMKSHSYFRTKMLYLTDNQYKNVKLFKKLEQTPLNITISDTFGQISRLAYFLMIPTLIYRDSYTLTPIRSMRRIIFHAVNFFACIYYCFVLYIVCCKQNIENLQKNLDFSTIVLTVIKLMLPSVFFLMMGFFGFLHSWMNLWAQITRFPDRAFYSDWWNSIEFGSYYRKWNIVVHDFLYYYVYLDSQRFFSICRKYKGISQLSTFFISAFIHEGIICLAIGYFYPILFILFTGPGIILIKNQKNLKFISVNFMFWLQMYIGTAMLFSLYLVQSFARTKISDSIVQADFKNISFLIPRTIYLGKI